MDKREGVLSNHVTRRDFLRSGTLATAGIVLPSYTKANENIYSFTQMTGEVSQTSAIVQTRLVKLEKLPDTDFDDMDALARLDVPGTTGVVRFEISESLKFKQSTKTAWIAADGDNDFIVKKRITGLTPGTRYYYRVEYGKEPDRTTKGLVNSFMTLPSVESTSPITFVVSSCLDFGHFFLGRHRKHITANAGSWEKPYAGSDRALGFPALETILGMAPAFWIQTGDNVYYDHPPETTAKTQAQLRAKWHRQMGISRMRNLLQQVPAYWMKDDHDTRYDDGDNTDVDRKPSPELGQSTFREQVPVVDPDEKGAVTYRTYQVNKLLQVWMPEGRDYRSPNTMPDGPGKSIWGKEQEEWLKRTLAASQATFKLLVMPTPLIGPDDSYKNDNHTNYGGFQYERDSFFLWLKENGFLKKNFYIITGDRHWQYHSFHPSGFEEYGTGTMVTPNARIGRKPGDPDSTDPLGLISQPFIQEEPTGGFIKVNVRPENDSEPATLKITIINEFGKELYSSVKKAV